ncbi:MAG: UvrD-helicase domain-containing protein [Solirubrobacteraceae bacterium]
MKLELSDDAQQALAADGSVLILGGPGSGKTTLSLLKAQGLIPDLKPGQEILFLSFSRAAVHQVVVRCGDVLTRTERQSVAVRTYHAFCMEILRTHGRLLSCKPARILYPRQERLQKASFEGEDWAVELQRLADEHGTYAFDQFAISCAALLQRVDSVRRLVANRYPVIIVDEFQDTNNAQWAVVRQLAEGSQLITLADPDQRIFEYDKTVDSARLDQLRAFLSPAEFDLGAQNHRSGDAGILGFADALLHNRPLPTTADVTIHQNIYPNALDATVHARVAWLLGELHKRGTDRSSVAVLCRTNALVSHVSQVLGTEHKLLGTTYGPISHDVAWDVELAAAAAAVVASMLEWAPDQPAASVASTLESIADFYDLKNADKPSDSARKTAASYRAAAVKVSAGEAPRIDAAKHLVTAVKNFTLSGVPAVDWKQAQAILAAQKKLAELHDNSRLVRLFGARDTIGRALSERWATSGSYGAARELVRRALDQGQLLTANTDHRGVVLMNMHKSKGKEFDGVLLVEGTYGSKFFDTREPTPYFRSRRLLRVAITRARHKVVLVRPRGSLPLTGSYE